MPFAIGLRVYRISVYDKSDYSTVQLGNKRAVDLFSIIDNFVTQNSTINEHDSIQRSWFLEEKSREGNAAIKGIINYGTFGFESNLIDRKTKKNNYRRLTTDLEEIPLYFQFWMPKGGDFGFFAAQSFQARSCVTLVTSSFAKYFEDRNSQFGVSFHKLMPEDVKGSKIFSSPVTKITMIKKSLPTDKADIYLDDVDPSEAEYHVTIKARRKKTLGNLIDFSTKDASSKVAAIHTSIEFDSAKAEISFGGRKRTVGIFGLSSEAGTIDITDSIDRGGDGHPTFLSVDRETNIILKDFYRALSKQQP